MLVAGPPGIGKTRLVEELARDVGDGEAGGSTVGWGAALDDDGMPMLWPWERAVAAWAEVRAALAADVTPETAGPADAAAATFAVDTAVLDALVGRRTRRRRSWLSSRTCTGPMRRCGCWNGSSPPSAGPRCSPSRPTGP